MRSRSLQGDTPGLEEPLRTGMGALRASSPSLVERAIRGSIIPARHGSGASVLPPWRTCGRLWAQAPRPPAIDAHPGS